MSQYRAGNLVTLSLKAKTYKKMFLKNILTNGNLLFIYRSSLNDKIWIKCYIQEIGISLIFPLQVCERERGISRERERERETAFYLK